MLSDRDNISKSYRSPTRDDEKFFNIPKASSS